MNWVWVEMGFFYQSTLLQICVNLPKYPLNIRKNRKTSFITNSCFLLFCPKIKLHTTFLPFLLLHFLFFLYVKTNFFYEHFHIYSFSLYIYLGLYGFVLLHYLVIFVFIFNFIKGISFALSFFIIFLEVFLFKIWKVCGFV